MTAEPLTTTLPRISRESLGVPSERDRYRIKRDITIEKVNTQLLPLMRKHGIDMWIVMDREYNPDPFANVKQQLRDMLDFFNLYLQGIPFQRPDDGTRPLTHLSGTPIASGASRRRGGPGSESGASRGTPPPDVAN